MKRIIRKYYLRAFYIATLVLSFLLLTLHFVFPSVGEYSVSFTQLAPALGVVFIFLILKDKTIITDIKHQIFIDKNFAKWLIPAIVIPSICIAVSSFIMIYYKNNYVAWKGNLSFYLLNAVALFIGCAAEEIGWRGFLLPNLQKRHGSFISSIIVGVLWGAWHLNFTGGILGFILYTVTIIEMSVLMTWVYNKSNKNLLLMLIWHFAFNLTSHIFLWDRFSLLLFAVEGVVFGIACLFILINERNTVATASTDNHI